MGYKNWEGARVGRGFIKKKKKPTLRVPPKNNRILCMIVLFFENILLTTYCVQLRYRNKVFLKWSEAFSLTQRCQGQHSAWLSAVKDNTQLDSALSTTAFSLTQRCPGQHSDEFANVVNSCVHLSEKSRRLELNYTRKSCDTVPLKLQCY